MEFNYFYSRTDTKQKSYMKFPKFLLSGEFAKIKWDTRSIYVLLFNKAEYSCLHGHFPQGQKIYIRCSVEKLKEVTGFSPKKIRSILAELEELGFIERKHQFGLLDKIFVKQLVSESQKPKQKVTINKNISYIKKPEQDYDIGDFDESDFHEYQTERSWIW